MHLCASVYMCLVVTCLFPMLLFHEVCHSSKIHLLINVLKLENGILKENGSNKNDVLFAYLPSHSLECLYD